MRYGLLVLALLLAGCVSNYAAGSYTTPGTSYSTVTGYGNTATVSTVSTPATVYETAGCLLTFIAANRGAGWIIEEYRVPKGLVC